MALDFIRESLEGLPEAFHPEYTKGEDGKFHLALTGGPDTKALEANNAKLLDEKKAALAKLKMFEGIDDPAKAKEALDQLRKLQEKELLEAGEVEKVIESRTKMMKADHEAQVKKLTEAAEATNAETGKLRAQLSKAVIERGILDAVNSVGQPRKEAIIDIIGRGNIVFKLDENGIPIPQNADGTTIFGKDGQKAMTMSEWASSLLETAPHLFHESKGGGAKGSIAALDGKTYSGDQLDKMSASQKMELGRGRAPLAR